MATNNAINSIDIPKSIVTAKGDMIVGTASSTPSKLSVGTDGYLIVANSGSTPGVKWDSPANIGIVTGGVSATDNAIARYDGVSGKLVQNSFVTVDDNGFITSKGITSPGKDASYKNEFFGLSNGNLTGTGQQNTSIGYDSMTAFTSANYNTAIGYRALKSLTTGERNVAVGVNALYSITDDYYNTAVGLNALLSCISDGNTAIGYCAMSNGADAGATNNCAFGSSSLFYNTGYNNVAMGNSSSYTNTTGYRNVAVGFQALYSNSTGNLNICVGNQAGENETGSGKLYVANGNGDKTKAIIYGEMDNSTPANQWARVNNSLGIGKDPTYASYSLDAIGAINTTDVYIAGSLLNGGYVWTTTSSNLTAVKNTGYITTNSSTRVNITLPASPSMGHSIKILGRYSAGWKVTCGSGSHYIYIGTSASSAGGYAQSSNAGDAMELVYYNNRWTAMSAYGTITLT